MRSNFYQKKRFHQPFLFPRTMMRNNFYQKRKIPSTLSLSKIDGSDGHPEVMHDSVPVAFAAPSGEYSEYSLFVSFDTITVFPQHFLPQLQYYIVFQNCISIWGIHQNSKMKDKIIWIWLLKPKLGDFKNFTWLALWSDSRRKRSARFKRCLEAVVAEKESSQSFGMAAPQEIFTFTFHQNFTFTFFFALNPMASLPLRRRHSLHPTESRRWTRLSQKLKFQSPSKLCVPSSQKTGSSLLSWWTEMSSGKGGCFRAT